MTKPELNITSPFFPKKKERNNATLNPKLTLATITGEWNERLEQQQK